LESAKTHISPEAAGSVPGTAEFHAIACAIVKEAIVPDFYLHMRGTDAAFVVYLCISP
jgi:hypothetical protein